MKSTSMAEIEKELVAQLENMELNLSTKHCEVLMRHWQDVREATIRSLELVRDTKRKDR